MSETLTGAERDAEAVRRVLAGETLDAIGASWGLTRERVRQLIRRATGMSVHELHGPKRALRAAEQKAQRAKAVKGRKADREAKRMAIRKQLRAFYAANGRVPFASEFGAGEKGSRRRADLPNYQVVRNHFGTLKNALRAEGLPSRGRGERTAEGQERVIASSRARGEVLRLRVLAEWNSGVHNVAEIARRLNHRYQMVRSAVRALRVDGRIAT